MADPFIAEIRMLGCNFAPRGWAFCNGQLLPIAQNTALFSLLGTNYGGNGQTTFGLPNLQGRAPMFWGQGPGLSSYSLGDTSGQAAVTLITTEMPSHTHTPQGINAAATATSPAGNMLAGNRSLSPYATPAAGSAMSGQAASTTGGGQPHNNMQPYLTINFCIAMQGIYPPRG